MSALPAEASSLLFDQYEVEGTLGQGAMGVVYLARDLRIGRHVALKTLQGRFKNPGDHPSAREYIERFRREAELCGSLLHPNVVTLYEVGWEARKIRYLAMEYVDGESLLGLLQRSGKLPFGTALKIIADVLSGLSCAHARGVVHRDIKPANILISRAGVAKITDFGIARSGTSSGDLTEQGQILGTPEYMSPEQIHGKEMDGQSDLFSAGVVLYEMLTGTKPFQSADIFEALYRVVNQPMPDVTVAEPSLPKWIKRFIGRMTCKDPRDRFLSASAALRELKRLAGLESHTLDEPISLSGDPRVALTTAGEDSPTTPISDADIPPLPVGSLLHQAVDPRIAYGVLALLMTIFVLTVLQIQSGIVEDGSPALSSDRVLEFSEKKRLLQEADVLSSAGAVLESRARLEAYLQRYPFSTAAKDRLERLQTVAGNPSRNETNGSPKSPRR